MYIRISINLVMVG